MQSKPCNEEAAAPSTSMAIAGKPIAERKGKLCVVARYVYKYLCFDVTTTTTTMSCFVRFGLLSNQLHVTWRGVVFAMDGFRMSALGSE